MSRLNTKNIIKVWCHIWNDIRYNGTAQTILTIYMFYYFGSTNIYKYDIKNAMTLIFLISIRSKSNIVNKLTKWKICHVKTPFRHFIMNNLRVLNIIKRKFNTPYYVIIQIIFFKLLTFKRAFSNISCHFPDDKSPVIFYSHLALDSIINRRVFPLGLYTPQPLPILLTKTKSERDSWIN